MGIGAAGGFEAGVGFGEAFADLAAAGHTEVLFGTPAAGGKALGIVQKIEAVAGSTEILFIAEREVRLHGGTHTVDMAVGVLAGENILTCGEGIEVPVVGQELDGEVMVALAGAAFGGDEGVFAEGVGFIPAKRFIAVRSSVLGIAGDAARGQVGLNGVESLVEDFEGVRRLGELLGVNEANAEFVVGVGGETVLVPEMGSDGGCEFANQTVDFGLGGFVAGGGVGTG